MNLAQLLWPTFFFFFYVNGVSLPLNWPTASCGLGVRLVFHLNTGTCSNTTTAMQPLGFFNMVLFLSKLSLIPMSVHCLVLAVAYLIFIAVSGQYYVFRFTSQCYCGAMIKFKVANKTLSFPFQTTHAHIVHTSVLWW